MSQPRRIDCLDSLRGIAAIGVAIFHHYKFLNPSGYPYAAPDSWLVHRGWLLVDFFFVLSGFVFAHVYGDAIRQRRVTTESYGLSRFSRIYPLHWLTLVYVAGIQALRAVLRLDPFVYGPNDLYHLLLNVVGIHGYWITSESTFNGPSWSISCEIAAYVAFFFVTSRSSRRLTTLLVYGAIAIFSLMVRQANLNLPFFNVEMTRVFIGFFVGAVLYDAQKRIDANGWQSPIGAFAFLLLAGGLAVIRRYGDPIQGNWPMCFTLFFFPMTILSALNFRLLRKALELRPLLYLGSISFSVYLIHFPVQITLATANAVLGGVFDFASPIFFLFYASCVIGLASLSYAFFERPAMAYIRRSEVRKLTTLVAPDEPLPEKRAG